MLKLEPIWTPPVQQKNYRALLQAMSRPGYVIPLFCHHNANALLAVLATLLDGEISLADQHGLLSDEQWLLLQAKSENAEKADFIVCQGDAVPDFYPKRGTLSSPEQSATVILQVNALHAVNSQSQTLRINLTGPGVKESIGCELVGLNPQWLSDRGKWISEFPMGVDVLLVDNLSLMAIPRTTTVELF